MTDTTTTIPERMRAVQIKGGKGPSSSLFIDADVSVPQPTDNDVLVKVAVFGLNRMDLLQREGAYPVPPNASPLLGVEFSGDVVASPGGHFKPGDHVFGLATGGAYAEYIACPAKMVLAKPTSLSHEQAAAIPENFLTAYQALDRLAPLRESVGRRVLIHAGASGVGLAAIQLARLLGATQVYVTAGSAEKCRFCESLGADKGINYKESDWAKELAALTKGEGVDIIMDFIGASYLDKNLSSLARDGTLVMQGMMGGSVAKDVNLGLILVKRLKIQGSTLRSRDLAYQSSLVQDFVRSGSLDKLAEGVSKEKGESDVHHIVIHKVFSWHDIQAAHDEMAANKNTGKIVVRVE